METVRLRLADIDLLAGREQEALALLPEGRRAQAMRIRPAQDRLHCIAAGLLLRHCLGVSRDEDLVCGAFGKPCLRADGPCFNLSHGGRYAVLALAGADVGVDVEPVKAQMPVTVPRRFLLEDERRWLEAEPTGERFVWLWTRLESALKADGRGLALEKRDFSVLNGETWRIESFFYKEHCISCAMSAPFEVEYRLLSAQELLE